MASARILLVEDEMDMMRITSRCLASAGHEVIPACDGLSATKLALDEQPDVIVLDIGLPAGDGHTVAERLQKNIHTMGIPVIYLTSHRSAEHVQRAKRLGAAGYLVKPYRSEALLEMIGTVLINSGRKPAGAAV